jgi:putative holliday junction resolvase
MRILAVDLGEKNVGLASCDELELTVRPLNTVQRTGNVQIASSIASEARRIEAAEVLVGHPLNMDGTAGRAAKDAEKIAALVAEVSGLPVRLWDERLSSWEAEQLLDEIGASKKKRRDLIHSASAAVILKSYVESRRQGGTT